MKTEIFDLNKVVLNQGGMINAIVIAVVVLVLAATARLWYLNRELGVMKVKLGMKVQIKKSKLEFLYFWLGVILLGVSFWTKDEIVWKFVLIVIQIWGILKIRDWGRRFVQHMNLENHVPWFLDLGKEMVLVLIIGCYVVYTIGFGINWVPGVLANSGERNIEIPSWVSSFDFQPKKSVGPRIPASGEVFANVWDEIAAGVEDEGGNSREAALLYALQRSECAKADFSDCISYAGAEGPFQFMPGTWPDYSDPNWSVWDLRDSSRAAYRMLKALKLFDQTDRLSFQNRFTGQDGGLVWNRGTKDSSANDGWDQSDRVWEEYQMILASANRRTETSVNGLVSISLSKDVPASQRRNVKIWAERNTQVVVPAKGQGKWSFCQATDNTGWDGYDYAGGISAGGICANTSMLYTWVQNTPGLEIEVATDHTPYAAWPVFTKAVNCNSMDFVIVNTTDQEIVGQWSIDGDTVMLGTVTK